MFHAHPMSPRSTGSNLHLRAMVRLLLANATLGNAPGVRCNWLDKPWSALALSKRNDPERLKNSALSVTPRTDLKPSPNRPISEVPRV